MAINLRVRTDNTFLSSTITVPKLIQLSLQSNFEYASICDVNNMFGVSEFYHLCLQNNLKPIIGVEMKIYFQEEKASSILLFAKNEYGYKNLVTLTSNVNQINTKALEKKDLRLYSENLICVIPSDNEYFNTSLKQNDFYQINEWLEMLSSLYRDLYFGVYRYRNCDKQNLLTQKELCARHHIASIAMQTVSHLHAKDTIILNLLDCIKNQQKASKEFLSNNAIVDAFFKDEHDLKVMYEPDELSNLRLFLNKCNVKIPHLPFSLPKVYKNQENPIQMMNDICQKRLITLGLDSKEYQKRLKYELDVIEKMGFGDYFLIVADYVNYAKTHDIMVGPARGSAASSLVAYLMNITTIDPLKHNLLFERFLNIARISMPDIDIDFLDVKRDQVIEYIKEKYGYKYVSHIGTFSTLGPKSAIRDIARILPMKNEEVDYLLSFYPKNEDIPLAKAYKEIKSFKEIVDRHQKYKQLVSLASQIEGLKRQSGMHAAGVVFYSSNLNEVVPVIEVNENTYVTQYDYKQIEKIGLIKMDILGLKNLTILDECFKKINKLENKQYTIDCFVYDYKEVYDFLATGNTLGIFQLESDGMKRTISELKPTCFEDIVSLLALFRPGPMKNISSFIARKHHKEEITYLHEDLKEILEPTYGIIVYQEQIMQIVQKIGHYSLSEADLFRRAIGKKDSLELQKQKNIFIQRSVENHYDKNMATALFDLIYRFAEYGFNKAHSVGYAKIAVIMAAVKLQYPEIFYATLFSMNADSDSKKTALMNEAKYFHISLKLPDINQSQLNYSIIDKKIMFGLNNIKSLKNKVASDILLEREKGLFLDIYDFIIRMVKINLNLVNIEALIYSGALDCFHISRSQLIANLLSLYDYGKMFYDLPYEPHDYQNYDYIPLPILMNKEVDVDFLAKEKEVLGVYLSKHPLTLLKEKCTHSITSLNEIREDSGSITILGKINRIDILKTKEGKDYLHIILEDETDWVHLYAYNQIALQYQNQFRKKDIVVVHVYVKNKQILYINQMKKWEE